MSKDNCRLDVLRYIELGYEPNHKVSVEVQLYPGSALQHGVQTSDCLFNTMYVFLRYLLLEICHTYNDNYSYLFGGELTNISAKLYLFDMYEFAYKK